VVPVRAVQLLFDPQAVQLSDCTMYVNGEIVCCQSVVLHIHTVKTQMVWQRPLCTCVMLLLAEGGVVCMCF